MEKQLVSVEEMAMILKVKPSWLYFRTMQKGPGSIPRLKLGKYLRFDPDEVLLWVKRQNEVV